MARKIWFSWWIDIALLLYLGVMAPLIGRASMQQPAAPELPQAPTENANIPTRYIPGGGAGDILPFYKNTQAQYGPAGVHNCGFSLNGWLAVDLFPNNGEVYAANTGDVSYVCRDSTQMSIRVGDHMYVHLVDTGIKVGDHINQGQRISTLVKGNFNDTCGNATQNPDAGHVHFCFIPDGNSYTADGWTLNTLDGNWRRGVDTVGTTGYLTAIWENANVAIPGSTVGANFWDGMAGGLVSFVSQILPVFPSHEAYGIAEKIIGVIKTPMDLVYNLVLVNFNMTITIWCFGIISALELIRLIYAGYMWVKRAIPVIG